MNSPSFRNPRFKPPHCLYLDCPSRKSGTELSPPVSHLVRKGSFVRLRDRVRVRRFLCTLCRRTFSSTRFQPEAWQKKRDLNEPIRKLLCSGVSQRRVARLLGIDRKTVAEKFDFLAKQARDEHEQELSQIETHAQLQGIQFDEMETFEHTKCKPLSIPLVVCASSRRILGFSVASMPAKGHLAKISIQKYGPRADERRRESVRVLTGIARAVSPRVRIETDQNPNYPAWIRASFPQSNHRAYKGKRGCIVGQGELKKIGFDPLFSFNHTAAMIRANVNRLFRRTWCTTKKADRLACHLWLYLQFHNREILGLGNELQTALPA